RAHAVRLVAEFFSEKGDTGEALAIIEKIEEDWYRAEALTHVASDLVKEKKFAEAREVARRAANDRRMAEIESLIAQVLIRDGQIDEAGAILEKVIAQLETVNDRAGKDKCLRELCDALTGTGRLDQGQKVAAAIDPRNWLRANALRWIANRLMESNKRE